MKVTGSLSESNTVEGQATVWACEPVVDGRSTKRGGGGYQRKIRLWVPSSDQCSSVRIAFAKNMLDLKAGGEQRNQFTPAKIAVWRYGPQYEGVHDAGEVCVALLLSPSDPSVTGAKAKDWICQTY
jgi:hypothetical protein